MNLIDLGVRNAGEMILPDGTHDIITEQVRAAQGYGRWVYCKYCYKNVRPAVSFPNARLHDWIMNTTGFDSEQLICSECGYGLDIPRCTKCHKPAYRPEHGGCTCRTLS